MSAYVRDEAFAQMSFLFTALNRVLALGGRVAETREFEEEPRAFLQTLASTGALIDAVGSWMALADEQEGLVASQRPGEIVRA